MKHSELRKSDERYEFHFLMLPGFSLISFASALEPLRIANKVMKRDAFRVHYCSQDGNAVYDSNGICIETSMSVSEIRHTDFLVLFSSDGVEKVDLKSAIRQTIRRLVHSGSGVAGVCTGAYALAALGLMDNRRCTIHWEYADIFREKYPHALSSAKMLARDGNVTTCAGGTAALDMMAHKIRELCGSDVSSAVLNIALHGQLRSEHENQLSDFHLRNGNPNSTVKKCVELMLKNIENPVPLTELASAVGMSRRSIERIFRTNTGLAPKAYYRKIRLETSRRLVEHSDIPISEAAMASGFTSGSHFSKSFREEYGISPKQLRRRSMHI